MQDRVCNALEYIVIVKRIAIYECAKSKKNFGLANLSHMLHASHIHMHVPIGVRVTTFTHVLVDLRNVTCLHGRNNIDRVFHERNIV